MEKEDKIIFNPSEELVKFANDFSDNYRIFSSGTYESDDCNYRIDYLDKIRDKLTKAVVNTPARIGHNSKIIQLDRSKLVSSKENPDFVFFLILWCIAKVDFKNCKYNDSYTDIFVLGYYLTTGRSLKNFILGFLNMVKNVENMEHNKKRYLIIDKYIKEYQENNK